MKEPALLPFQQGLIGQQCPNCRAPSLAIAETRDLIDDYADIAEQVGANIEVISIETEERPDAQKLLRRNRSHSQVQTGRLKDVSTRDLESPLIGKHAKLSYVHLRA